MKKKKIISIIVLVLGLIVLAVGVGFLVVKLLQNASMQDGEYLISAENWVLDENTNCNSEEATNCESGVIWKFTEIGKGTLTTNNHLNDYDFIWALEDGKLKIETDWLYTLNNEYEYTIDQSAGILTLKDDDEEIKLVANFAND